MTRKKKTVLGLAALALVAMSAFTVSGAQGNSVTPEATCLESHDTHVACTGHGVQASSHRHSGLTGHKYEAGFATLSCTTATFEVTTDADGTDEEPEAKPTYSGCTFSPGGFTAHVNTNSCEYTFSIFQTTGQTVSEDEYSAEAEITCPGSEKFITITITNGNGTKRCHIEIKPQAGIVPILFRTMTSADPTDVTVEANTAIASADFSGSFLDCGVFPGIQSIEYSGNVTVIAKNEFNVPIDAQVDWAYVIDNGSDLSIWGRALLGPKCISGWQGGAECPPLWGLVMLKNMIRMC